MMILFLVLVLVAGKSFVEGTPGALVRTLLSSPLFSPSRLLRSLYHPRRGSDGDCRDRPGVLKGLQTLVKDREPRWTVRTVFPFAPNAVIVGFLASFVAGLVSMFLCPLFGLSVIVPGLVPHFFCGATAGVYGNITGGRRGAVVGAFAHGLLISFLPAILLPMMGDMGLGSTTFGDADFGVVGIVLGHIIAMFN